MRRIVIAALSVALAFSAAPAAAAKRHHAKKPSGIEGVVLDATCQGPCAQPPAPQPAYSGVVTVTVLRVSDGATVAGQTVSNGKFRMKVKRGLYDVSSVPPNPPVCQPQPQPRPQPQQICPPPCTPTTEIVCPLASAPAAIIAPCLTGETKRIEVRRHRFTHVELHVTNVFIV